MFYGFGNIILPTIQMERNREQESTFSKSEELFFI